LKKEKAGFLYARPVANLSKNYLITNMAALGKGTGID
jgi:hypothetical protein